MADLIDALPGIKMPVAEVTRQLAFMWSPEDGADSPSAFRASQMNLILHFGIGVTPEDARARFDTAIRFAQRYPSRIIVLCPVERDAGAEDGLESKLFSQCYIGSSHREMCCCEALLLSYSPRESEFLTNQASVWLEGDLPTYHWLCGVPAERVNAVYEGLVSTVRRIVYDSDYEGQAFDADALRRHAPARDLASARILPVRQSLGQFLSGYDPVVLRRGLRRVEVRHGPGLAGEAFHLEAWLRRCLRECEERADEAFEAIEWSAGPLGEEDDAVALRVVWTCDDVRRFRWEMFEDLATGRIEADFGGGETVFPTRVRWASGADALAEALFF